MGARGAKPEPVNLRLLKGRNPGRDSGNRPIPVLPPFERIAPDPPPEVAGDEIASEAWDRWVAELVKVDVLRRVDFAALALACSSYAHFRRIEIQLQAEIQKKGTGAYLSPTRDGTPTLNPLWRARDQAVAALHRTLRECGLTPSSEGVLGKPQDKAPPAAEQNPFG